MNALNDNGNKKQHLLTLCRQKLSLENVVVILHCDEVNSNANRISKCVRTSVRVVVGIDAGVVVGIADTAKTTANISLCSCCWRWRSSMYCT